MPADLALFKQDLAFWFRILVAFLQDIRHGLISQPPVRLAKEIKDLFHKQGFIGLVASNLRPNPDVKNTQSRTAKRKPYNTASTLRWNTALRLYQLYLVE